MYTWQNASITLILFDQVHFSLTKKKKGQVHTYGACEQNVNGIMSKWQLWPCNLESFTGHLTLVPLHILLRGAAGCQINEHRLLHRHQFSLAKHLWLSEKVWVRALEILREHFCVWIYYDRHSNIGFSLQK